MIWEVKVCGSDNFVSSALNNDAILGTREKSEEGQVGPVAWSAWARGWWMRGCVSLLRFRGLRVIL